MVLPVDPLLAIRVGGMRVTARLSSMIVLAVIVGGALPRLDPAAAAGLGVLGWIPIGIVTWVVICAMLVAHEAVRVWACRRLGATVPRVDFYLFGGLPHLRDVTLTPRDETLAGLAGLGVLAALGGCVAVGDLVTRHASVYLHLPLRALLIACGGFAIFHLLPAIPLDGGQILRAWLWYLTDDLIVGTQAVALYAYLIAIGLVIGGVLLFPLADAWSFWGLWVAIAAWQMAGAARIVMQRTLWERAGDSVTVGRIAAGMARRIAVNVPIDDAADRLLEAGTDAAFLVTDAGQPVGALLLADLRRIPSAAWADHTVAEVMAPLAGLPRLDGETSLIAALALLDERQAPLAIIECQGKPCAAVTTAQLTRRLRDLRPDQSAESMM